MNLWGIAVTVSLLPAQLYIINIPRARLTQSLSLWHPVLRQILSQNPTFFNITFNEIELTIFTEDPSVFLVLPSEETLEGEDNLDLDETWRVIQIDSHESNDQLDTSGARVHELSAPLAAAGISILYQSSYMSDFIFVRESSLHDALDLFVEAGFDMYPSEPEHIISPTSGPSPPMSPGSDDKSSIEISSVPPTSAVLTRSRSSTNESLKSFASKADKVREEIMQQYPSSRAKSHSPASGDVKRLSSDLACVGLAEADAERWTLKIIKLIAFPDLVTPSFTPPYGREASALSALDKKLAFHGGPDSASPPSSGPVSNDDGPFSPNSTESSSLFTSDTGTSRSSMESTNFTTSEPTKPTIPIMTPLENQTPQPPGKKAISKIQTHSLFSSARSYQIPFFSFTRTSEGSSLTSDVAVLAKLFPPTERHMIVSGGELDAADAQEVGGESSSTDDSSDELSLQCLQIDLRKFGLDKHGLVNRFSHILQNHKINHLYSATYKTANLLVDKRNAARAQTLLRTC